MPDWTQPQKRGILAFRRRAWMTEAELRKRVESRTPKETIDSLFRAGLLLRSTAKSDWLTLTPAGQDLLDRLTNVRYTVRSRSR